MNKNTIQKLKILFIPFLIISFGFCTVYTFLNWLLLIRLELFTVKEIIVEFGIPFILPVIPVLFFFRTRLKILNLKKSTGRTYNDLYLFVLWLFIAGPALIAQDYLKNSTGKLSQIENVSQISKQEQTKYYKVKNFYLDKSTVGVHTSFETGGRNNDLDINLFIVVPIFDKKKDTINSSCKYWLGIKYDDRISNRLDEKEKQDRYESFLNESQFDFDRKDLSDFVYLERVGNSDISDGYKEALTKINKINTEGSVLFISKNEPFENRKGNTIHWFIGTFLMGTIVWLIMILIPKCNETELRRLKSGTSKDKDLKEFFNFIKPREGYFITPILIYSNVLIYLIMVIAGLGFLSFNGPDLLNWGGNFRPYTTNGQWWRLLTNIFLHGGLLHLMSNMFGLLFVGLFIEPVLGRTKYLILYLVTGILASCVSIWWHEATISIGASGAIFGLYGIFLGLLLRKVFPPDLSKVFLTTTLIFIAYNLIMGLAGGIDNSAHIGGLLSGFVFGIIMSKSLKEKNEKH
ncbi:membrane associated rhomboid family serine protease [Flavobacterium sp. HSC-32F16]|uniref:rhomboid family intramembrane serine protease n=1 Tax=Flavobacterium sp. HSC-32F16 TaxID=2910964 RepID=UPI0020A5A0D2|nr:rhomboid family intramembrane serine protease [Flavobacterium sp. HSC-32F16]MCP2025855.1 membrane associated rhomboid family serine protease [Flavobacterium sp. HSC-32F16]